MAIELLLPIHPTPSCWQLPMCVLSLWIYLFWIFHTNGNIQYVTFCVYFHSLNNVFEVHLYCSIYQYFISFYGLIFHWTFIFNYLLICLFVCLFCAPGSMRNFPNQGWNPCPLQWKCRVLTTGPPGKSSLRVYTTIYLSIQLLVDIYIVYIFGSNE